MADNKVVTSKSIKEAEVEGPDDAAAEAAPVKKAPAKKKAASPKEQALILIGTGSFARATDKELKAFYQE